MKKIKDILNYRIRLNMSVREFAVLWGGIRAIFLIIVIFIGLIYWFLFR